MTDLLRLETVAKSFGAVKAVDRMSLTVAEGEALGVLGPNGAGKSTLFNLITGDLTPDAGRVFYAGADITDLPPWERCRRGLSRTYQIPHPFAGMTVFENVMVGATFGGAMRERDAATHCYGILERLDLADQANRLAGSLTLLDRKRLELARAMSTRPRILLMDEIAGGVRDEEAGLLIDAINGLRKEGVAIVWVEHVIHALLKVVDRLVVMNFGAKLTEGAPAAVMASREVKEVYLGVDVEPVS